jgi:hypothetical protein
MKAKFGSIRIQALQDEFAQFASDLMSLKAEVIAKHFDPLSIARYSNMQNSIDKELLPQAIDLIKQFDDARLRIEIRPESVAMVDYAQIKAERTDYINALSMFMQSSAPLMDADPAAKPFLLKMLQWGLAGFKGSQEIEGILDKAIEAAEKPPAEAENQPDPAQQAMQMQAQIDMQKEQAKQQGELAKIQAKAQADMSLRKQDMDADIQTSFAQAQAKQMEINADMSAKLAEIETKMRADIVVEQAKMEAHLAQTDAAAAAEIRKNFIETKQSIEAEAAKTALRIKELSEKSNADAVSKNRDLLQQLMQSGSQNE